MATFREANQTRIALKMKLSNYYWYHSSRIAPDGDNYMIIVGTTRLDDQVRAIIPVIINGVSIKTELEIK